MGSRASSGFVGRLEELRELSRCLDEAFLGRGRLVIVSGEGGIGKTRLCEELASIADGLGAGVAWATCWESGGLPPFSPWWQLLEQIGADVRPAPTGENAPDVARAHQFAAVFDAMRMAALVRPRLLVLDDVQWADAGTRHLLAEVGFRIRSIGAVLVTTVRDVEAAFQSGEPAVVRHARVVRLAGLRVDELGTLVAQVTGSPAKPEISQALHRATAGNPLFTTELVRRLHREGRLELLTGDHHVPVSPTVRAVLDEQLADLTDTCRVLLAIAAVAGHEFPVALVAELAGRDRLAVLADIEQAATAGIIVTTEVGRYAFTHPLLRSVVHDDIGVAERVRLHQRIGDTLEAHATRGAEVDPAVLSFHYLNGALGGTAGKAVFYAARAAEAAMAALGYEDAVALYDRALAADALNSERSDRGSLLLGAGEARAAAGDTRGARGAFLAAADQARRTGRSEQLALAALGLAGAGFEVALFDDQQIALLEEALTVLGDDQPALRSQVSARLSVALSLAGQDEQRAALSETAVRLARDADDTAALIQALAARCDSHAGPDHLAQRVADAGQIVRMARQVGDHAAELLGRRLQLVASLEAGDLVRVDAELHAFARVAEWLRQPRYQWYVLLWRATRAAMQGKLAEQRTLAAEADALGRAAGSVNTDILLLAHRWYVWLEAGDLETAVTEIDKLLPPSSYAELGPQMIPLYVMQRLLAGHPEEARAVLDGAAGNLRTSTRDSEWVTTLAQVGVACFRLGGHELSGWIYDELAPFADQWAIDGIGAYAHGPVHRFLGLLSVLIGRRAEASAHFDAALMGNRRAGADMLVARTLFDRGVALDEPNSLRAALDLYRRLGAEHRIAEIESLLGETDVTAVPKGAEANNNELRQEGETWTVTFAGRRCHLRDAKGVRDIARLLAQPGVEIAAVDLAAVEAPASRGGDLGETVDARARASYKSRLVELEAELDEADTAGNIERSARAHAERDALLDQLSSAYGLGGRPRRAGDPAERARTAVTARIRDAIRRIEAVHPDLGRHLVRSVRTGTFCCYDPDGSLHWEL